MAPLPAKIAALTLPRTVPAKFDSPDSISSYGKKVQLWTAPSKSSSSILAFKHSISRRQHLDLTITYAGPLLTRQACCSPRSVCVTTESRCSLRDFLFDSNMLWNEDDLRIPVAQADGATGF